MTIFDGIFSIKEYNETTNILTVFGIRIKFLKKQYAQALKQNPFDEYRKKNIDITTIPPATGQLRDIQLANLVLLKELDYVCKQSGLKYWVDYGTLLGAVRHKGFIPWDDDIDVGMMREDYDRMIDAFLKYSRNPNIYVALVYIGRGQAIIKIKHKKCAYLFVDIFPHDYYNDVLSEQEQFFQTKKLRMIRQELNKDKSLNSFPKVSMAVKQLNKKIIKDVYVEHSDIMCGLEYFYTEPLWIYSYDLIMPLKTIEFEGLEVSCVNKPHEYLKKIMGNYMDYPTKIGVGHSAYAEIPKEQMDVVRKLGKKHE